MSTCGDVQHEHEPDGEVPASGPSWDALYAVAGAQQGVFTVEQAAGAGFSAQLLNKHLRAGRVERVHRGIYRLTRFPAAQRAQEELVVAWLWSGQVGVLSHETALQLHGLSDALPSRVHLTVPASWASRRVRPPALVELYCAGLDASERAWVGPVPVTTPGRSVVDVAAAHGDAAVLDAAIRQALRDNAASLVEVAPAVAYLAEQAARPAAGPVGRWLLDVVSGTCRAPLPPDWRVDAEQLARRHGGQLHAATYLPGPRALKLELRWPCAGDAPPEQGRIYADAAQVFGWR